jgi:PII-like signaling protein
MPELHDAALLRIYIGDDDTYDERPLYEAIVRAARDAGLAGVTVVRGILGYGRSAHVHEIHKGFSHDLPVIVEIVDEPAAIEAWLPVIEHMNMLRAGVAVVERVQIARFHPRS